MTRYKCMVIIWGIGVCLAGCSGPTRPVTNPAGIFNGQTYTSAKGSFSIYVSGLTGPAGLKDGYNPSLSQEYVSFYDAEGNFYGVFATYKPAGLAADFITSQYENFHREIPWAVMRRTPDGIPCIFIQKHIPENKMELGRTKLTVVFVRGKMIYDITVKTKTAASPQAADTIVNEAINKLWDQSVFRTGRHRSWLATYAFADPRLPIVLQALQQASDETGAHWDVLAADPESIHASVSRAKGGDGGRFEFFLKDGQLFYRRQNAGTAGEDSWLEQFTVVFERIMAEEKLSVFNAAEEKNRGKANPN